MEILLPNQFHYLKEKLNHGLPYHSGFFHLHSKQVKFFEYNFYFIYNKNFDNI